MIYENGALNAHGLSSVTLVDSPQVRDGLSNMLTAAIGDHGYSLSHVDVQLALLVIEAALRAEDRKDWFPCGKWATIQTMRERTERELQWLFQSAKGAQAKSPEEHVTWKAAARPRCADAMRYRALIEAAPSKEVCFLGRLYFGKASLDAAIDAHTGETWSEGL